MYTRSRRGIGSDVPRLGEVDDLEHEGRLAATLGSMMTFTLRKQMGGFVRRVRLTGYSWHRPRVRPNPDRRHLVERTISRLHK
jgi:hypothetical protein